MSRPFLSSIGIVFICGLFLLIGFLSLNQMFIYTPDSARYLVWANSIAQGEGFTDTTTPEVSRYVVHAPLYSLLLAPIAYFFAQNVLAAKGTTLLIGCLVLIFFYIWTKKKVGEPIALLGSLILALNSHMIVFSTQILSDAPFAVCLVLYFILAEKLLEKENPPMIMEMSFIAAIIAGIFLREVGFALLLGAVVFYVWKKRYRSAAVLSLATLLIYLLWYVRNEIIVAGVENPALRNTNVFFMHLYTSSRETIWAEFGARLLDNVSVYTRLAGKLLFLPGYPGHASSLISPSDPLVGLVLYAFPVIQFILICATVGICTIGVWHELKNPKIFSLVLIYLIFYCGLILLYPINDIRFLFPLLIVMVYLCTVGMKQVSDWMIRIKIPAGNIVGGSVLLLILLPSCIWVNGYIRNSRYYQQSPELLFEQFKGEKDYPWHFSKPLDVAAAWIDVHSDSLTVVMSRWKELTFWLKGRKIIEIHPQVSPDMFDRLLRDYPVKYIVGAVSAAGLNEYESLLNRSRLYQFEKVSRIANVEIFEVLPKEQKLLTSSSMVVSDSSAGSLWHKALCILEDNPAEAKGMFKKLMVNYSGYTEGIFHIGCAEEFALDLDSAIIQFEKVRLMPQAGAFVQQASYHLEIIPQLKQALDTNHRSEGAQLFNSIGSRYWELGFRKQALNMLQRSLEADPHYFLSRILSAFFSLQLGDTLSARKSLLLAQTLNPNDPYVLGLASLLNDYSALPFLKGISKQIDLRLNIANSYLALGLQENAIDELLQLLRSDPIHQRALWLLGDIYEKKQRYAPAMHIYKRLLVLNRTDSHLQKKLEDVSLRCSN